MTDQRRRVGVFAAGAVSLALIASPLATLAQDGEMAGVSEACQAASLGDLLKTEGRLTISTDNPAYFPWWAGSVPEGSDWATFGGYPPSGGGFEGAMAYAIARELGFQPNEVDWVFQSEFGQAFAPGDKDFDFHLGQIAITEERATAVDFSDSYYEASQSVVALAADPINEVTTLEELKDFQLGAPGTTTSFRIIEDVIQPNVEPKAPENVATATQQLVNGQIQGLVVDTPTAFYLVTAELPFEFGVEGSIVGQVIADSGETFGLVLQKDSDFTACANEAIAAVREGGRHQQILDTWIAEANSAPLLP